MKTLSFTKMQGAGNDFVMLNGIAQNINPTPELIRFLADRRFGIGADQVLMVERSERSDTDFRYRIFNCDGGEVEQCGNGARCFAVFVREEGLTQSRRIRVETMKAVIEPVVTEDGRVTVDMGEPRFMPSDLPFVPDGLETKTEGLSKVYHAPVGCGDVCFSTASMGNPHAVIVVDDVNAAPVETVGPAVEHCRAFPARVNVGFLEVVDRTHAKLRVWERGAGETLACGTGSCAAVVEGIRRGYFDSEVTLEARGGTLTIRWDGLSDPYAKVYLTGPAVTVFKGTVTLPEELIHD